MRRAEAIIPLRQNEARRFAKPFQFKNRQYPISNFPALTIGSAHETRIPPWRAGSRQAHGRKSAVAHSARRLFDNHAAIDLARTLFDFGAPGVWELVHTVRCAALDAAAANGVALVVTTFCYADPDDRPQFENFEEILRRRDGHLLPVFLHCPRDEALRRVGNPDRVERRKMISAPSLTHCLDDNNFTPVPRADCLILDIAARSAQATAPEIVRHFGLT